MPVDNHMKRMMQDLCQAFVQAIATSSHVGHAVSRIRQEGYSLHLVLSSRQEGERRAQIELTARHAPSREPAFRLDSSDVSLLKDLGIDAARPGRRRR